VQGKKRPAGLALGGGEKRHAIAFRGRKRDYQRAGGSRLSGKVRPSCAVGGESPGGGEGARVASKEKKGKGVS